MTTNPYLTARRAQYEAGRQTLQAIQTRATTEHRDLTDQERARVEQIGAQLQEIGAEIAADEAEQTRQDQINTRAAEIATGQPAVRMDGGAADVRPPAEAVPSLMPSRDQLDQLVRTAETRTAVRVPVAQPDVHARAALTTTATGLGVAASGGVVLREPRRISTAVPLTVERVRGTEGLTFPVFGAGTAGIQTEGATKAEYAAVTPGSATPQLIAVWTDFTMQATLGTPAFEGRLRAKHAALVARREDVLLVSRLQGVTGAQTLTAGAGQSYADALLAASGLVLSSDVAAAPDLILVNPADLPLIFPSDTTQGLNGTSPDSEMRLSLHGATVYPTSAVTAGSAIVTALGASARFVVGLDPTVMVDAMSGLKTNTVTMLLEEAVTLAIDEPTGVVLVDLIP